MCAVPPSVSRSTVLVLLLSGCGGDGGPSGPQPPPAGGIGPAGGIVTSADGRASLVVPPNALSGTTALTVTATSAVPLDPRAVAQSAYAIGPAGVQFATPATLTLQYNPALAPVGIVEDELMVHQLNNGAWTTATGGEVDAPANTATVAVSRAGTYGVRWPGLAGPCTAPEHRQFDFWLGEWDFVVPGTPPGATNSISADADGCAINENFLTPTGVNGRSVSFYHPANGQWHQTYIDSNGTRLQMSGGLEGGAMLLYTAPASRFGWAPGADQVRYYGESSTDGGTSWTVTFDSRYVRP
jgi:hypothetical protein